MSNTLPQTIGQYQIIEMIGRGGMGAVYKAIDPRLEREVAIKVIKLPDDPSITAATRKELVERFKREAKASAKLNHPNIVSVYDFGEENGDNYMVMEMLYGRDLDELLKIKSPMSMDIALKSLIQVCSALDFAHRRGIIHRDIKPGNIVILDNGVSKLADFGIARVEASQSNLTQAGSILGSLMYISPEQLMSAGSVDKRADIYSLGVTAYEILTGQLPYTGDNIAQIITKLMNSEPPLPSQINSDLPTELDFVLFKAMSKTPDSRYSTAEEFGKAMNEILAKHGSGETFSMPMSSSNTSSMVSSTSATVEKENPTVISSSPTVMGGDMMNLGSSPTMMGKPAGPELFKLVQGIDDFSLYSAVHRVVQKWNIENLSTNTMLEAIYLHEGKSQALVINNNVILLIYRGLIIGSVMRQPELFGPEAYAQMASWQKFEMKQCLPLEKDEVWLIILAIVTGSNRVKHHNPMCDQTEFKNILTEQKKAKFTGMIKVLEKQVCNYLAFLDGEQIFTIELPYPEGQHEATFVEVTVLLPRLKLHGPSLRHLLADTGIQLVKKSVNTESLSHYASLSVSKIKPDEFESAIRNTDFSFLLPQDNIYNIGSRKVKDSDIFKETDHFQFVNWLMFQSLYAVAHAETFKNVIGWFKWATEIKSFKFLQPMKAPGGFSATFDVIGYNSDDQLTLLARSSYEMSPEKIDKVIDDIEKIRADQGNVIKAVVLMSRKEISEDSINHFNNITSKPWPTSIGAFFNPMQGYVRTKFYKGFYLFLIHLNDNLCEIKAPEFN